MASHERAAETDIHGHPYCSRCGLLEVQWTIRPLCDAKPVLSVVPPADLTELDRFAADPLSWLQEWTEKNGKVECEKLAPGFAVYLWVEGEEQIPLSTGVAPTLTHAFQNAIRGLDGLSTVR